MNLSNTISLKHIIWYNYCYNFKNVTIHLLTIFLEIDVRGARHSGSRPTSKYLNACVFFMSRTFFSSISIKNKGIAFKNLRTFFEAIRLLWYSCNFILLLWSHGHISRLLAFLYIVVANLHSHNNLKLFSISYQPKSCILSIFHPFNIIQCVKNILNATSRKILFALLRFKSITNRVGRDNVEGHQIRMNY